MKTIILAGGSGSRLLPATKIYNKHLVLLYDKPLIYYPLATSILAGCKELAIVVRPCDQHLFRSLLGDGSAWGIKIDYVLQSDPLGIAHGLVLCERFINGQHACLLLGDNVFLGEEVPSFLNAAFRSSSPTIFCKEVKDPTHFGVAVYRESDQKLIKIIEKPNTPVASNDAVTGLYVYNAQLAHYLSQLKGDDRTGELGITELNNLYIKSDCMNPIKLTEQSDWFDAGKPSTLFEAAKKVRELETLRGHPVGCPYYAAYINGNISSAELEKAFGILSPEYRAKLHAAVSS